MFVFGVCATVTTCVFAYRTATGPVRYESVHRASWVYYTTALVTPHSRRRRAIASQTTRVANSTRRCLVNARAQRLTTPFRVRLDPLRSRCLPAKSSCNVSHARKSNTECGQQTAHRTDAAPTAIASCAVTDTPPGTLENVRPVPVFV